MKTWGCSTLTNAPITGKDGLLGALCGEATQETGHNYSWHSPYSTIEYDHMLNNRLGRAGPVDDFILTTLNGVFSHVSMRKYLHTQNDPVKCGSESGYCAALCKPDAAKVVGQISKEMSGGEVKLLIHGSQLKDELRRCGVPESAFLTADLFGNSVLPALMITRGTHTQFIFFVHGTGCRRLTDISAVMGPLVLRVVPLLGMAAAPAEAQTASGPLDAPQLCPPQSVPQTQQTPELPVRLLTPTITVEMPGPEIDALMKVMQTRSEELSEQASSLDAGVDELQAKVEASKADNQKSYEAYLKAEADYHMSLQTTERLLKRQHEQKEQAKAASQAVGVQAVAETAAKSVRKKRRTLVESYTDEYVEKLDTALNDLDVVAAASLLEELKGIDLSEAQRMVVMQGEQDLATMLSRKNRQRSG